MWKLLWDISHNNNIQMLVEKKWILIIIFKDIYLTKICIYPRTLYNKENTDS